MGEDMNIESLYEVNDKVWFYNDSKGIFYEGTITLIPGWDQWNGFNYEITHNNDEVFTIPESRVFKSKEEIIENCFEEEE